MINTVPALYHLLSLVVPIGKKASLPGSGGIVSFFLCSKSCLPKILLDVSPHDLRHRFAIAWRSLSRSIGWSKSWVVIRWIPPSCKFKGPSMIGNKRLRLLHGHKLEEKKR